MFRKNIYYQLRALVFFLGTASLVHAGYPERILSFHADITVNKDASINVIERITVQSFGRQIKRGIVREFPTRYTDRFGNNMVVDFIFNYALKEGVPVNYDVSNYANGKVIALGDDTYIQHGRHTYTIAYTTTRQLGFFKDYDELYWNVTGNGWRLPIEHASARVALPSTIPADTIRTDGYTGAYGYTGSAYRVTQEADGSLLFQTTRPLSEYEGLTIVAVWPKGYINAPTWRTHLYYFFYDNILLLIATLALCVLGIFFAMQWRAIQMLNRQETVIPQFYPPENMSPGTMRYIATQKSDHTAFAAEIVALAVRGFLTIDHKTHIFSSSYTLTKNESPPQIPTPQEQEILNTLFATKNQIDLSKPSKEAERAATKFDYTLKQPYNYYFTEQHGVIATVFGLIILGVIIPVFFHGNVAMILLFCLMAAGIGALCVHFIFTVYTDIGRKRKAEIDGFKMFLEATESERMKVIGTPPTKTPELYEHYLPYAIALGVEQAWSRQFAPVFARLEQEGRPYIPMWYHGRTFRAFNAPAFSSNLTRSFSSAISSAATPPGSRSGFRGGSGGGRGGGFSGGGGGGGGGGGR